MEDWRDKRACRDVSPDVFFPEDAEGNKNAPEYPARVEAAKAICARCEVAEACLTTAIEYKEGSGIWGGLTADERPKLAGRRWRVDPSRGQRRPGTIGGSNWKEIAHGTAAGAQQHRRRNLLPMDEACAEAEREYNREYNRRRRDRRVAS